jgi:hypothetical protein
VLNRIPQLHFVHSFILMSIYVASGGDSYPIHIFVPLLEVVRQPAGGLRYDFEGARNSVERFRSALNAVKSILAVNI